MLKKYVSRTILPAIGLALVALLVFQSRSLGSSRGAKTAPPPPAASHVAAQGHVTAYPGAEITVSCDVAGIVAHVAVHEKDVVKKGDLIATIDDSELRAALAEAESRVGEADADVRLYESETARARDLWQ